MGRRRSQKSLRPAASGRRRSLGARSMKAAGAHGSTRDVHAAPRPAAPSRCQGRSVAPVALPTLWPGRRGRFRRRRQSPVRTRCALVYSPSRYRLAFTLVDGNRVKERMSITKRRDSQGDTASCTRAPAASPRTRVAWVLARADALSPISPRPACCVGRGRACSLPVFARSGSRWRRELRSSSPPAERCR